MQGKISVFGVITGVLVVVACVLLLQGVAKATSLPQDLQGADKFASALQSLESYVHTLMAVGAVILLSSLISKPGLRACLFITTGIAAIWMARDILPLYLIRDLYKVSVPTSLHDLTDLTGWAVLLRMPQRLESFLGTNLAVTISGDFVGAALFLGAIYACARPKTSHAARMTAGITALIGFIMLIVVTLIGVIKTPNLMANFNAPSEFPVRDGVFAAYSLAFCLAGLGAVIFPIHAIFFPDRARRHAAISFRVLVVMGVSLPVVLFGMIFWTGQITELAGYPIHDYWAAACAFTAIAFALLLLPFILLANGVSILLQRFTPPAAAVNPAPQGM
jgi:hypothetical protein